jgi:hypothetical protein
MPKYYVKWEMRPQMTPSAPEETFKLLLSLLEMTKQDMQTGGVKDWGVVAGESCGYSIVELPSEVDFATNSLKWMRYVNFEVKPVLTVDQSVESIKKAAAAAQAKK